MVQIRTLSYDFRKNRVAQNPQSGAWQGAFRAVKARNGSDNNAGRLSERSKDGESSRDRRLIDA